MDDGEVVAAQIGRRPRSDVVVAGRCHLDLPTVAAVPPILDDGTPFPTRYWLGCPLAVTRISRIESSGGVGRAEALLAADSDMADRHDRAMERYQNERDGLIPEDHAGPRPSGGIAGTTGRGVKCLHAQYADHAAGNDNPIGEWVACQIEPLNCTTTCVALLTEEVALNPEWSEPSR